MNNTRILPISGLQLVSAGLTIALLMLVAAPAAASTVITPNSLAGQNISRAADYLDKTLGEPKVAAKIRSMLKKGHFYVDDHLAHNGETSFFNNVTLAVGTVLVPGRKATGKLCESSNQVLMGLFLDLVGTLFHELVHVDQSIFGDFKGEPRKERGAWEGTMEAKVKWLNRLWLQYKKIDKGKVCARRLALKNMKILIKNIRAYDEVYRKKYYANFLWWWTSQVARATQVESWVDKEAKKLGGGSGFAECIEEFDISYCEEPYAISELPESEFEVLLDEHLAGEPVSESEETYFVTAAAPDSASVSEGGWVWIPVLSNDEGLEMITEIEPPEHGWAYASGSWILYISQLGHSGHDGFAYTATNGEFSERTVVSITVQGETPPPAPSELHYEGAGFGTATLSWATSEHAVDYEIYRNGVPLGEADRGPYVDSDALEYAFPTYSVVAVDEWGNRSAPAYFDAPD